MTRPGWLQYGVDRTAEIEQINSIADNIDLIWAAVASGDNSSIDQLQSMAGQLRSIASGPTSPPAPTP